MAKAKPKKSLAQKLGVVVGPTRYLQPSSGEVRYTLDLLDLDAGGLEASAREPERIALEFFAHGVAFNPKEPWRAALFEKRGAGAAYVDLHERKVLASIEALPDHAFYGHGAFDAKGERLFAVEMHLPSRDGTISVRAPKTFKPLDRFPTYGAAPHDCHLVEGGKVLVITNGGGKHDEPERLPNVAFVDAQTYRLLDRFEVDDPQINAGHVASLKNRSLALVSAPRDGLPEDTSLGGLSLRSAGGALHKMREPEGVVSRFVGESLSVAIHGPSRTVFATHPFGGLATVWSLEHQRILAAVDLLSARGVTLTLDERYFVVSAGVQAGLVFFETSPFRQVQGTEAGAGRFGGSHIYTWKRCAPYA